MAKAHYIRLTLHSAERLRDLLRLSTFVEAAEAADRIFREAKPDVPGRNGAWWYTHKDAILCVGHPDGAPLLYTACPPTWTLTKDVGGGDWYWCVGPRDHRNSSEVAASGVDEGAGGR